MESACVRASVSGSWPSSGPGPVEGVGVGRPGVPGPSGPGRMGRSLHPEQPAGWADRQAGVPGVSGTSTAGLSSSAQPGLPRNPEIRAAPKLGHWQRSPLRCFTEEETEALCVAKWG